MMYFKILLAVLFFWANNALAQDYLEQVNFSDIRAKIHGLPQSTTDDVERKRDLLDLVDRLNLAADKLATSDISSTSVKVVLSKAEIIVAVMQLQDAVADPVGGMNDIFSRANFGVKRVENSIKNLSNQNYRIISTTLNQKPTNGNYMIYVIPVGLYDYAARIPENILVDILMKLSFNLSEKGSLAEDGGFLLWIGSCCNPEGFSGYLRGKRAKKEGVPNFRRVMPFMPSDLGSSSLNVKFESSDLLKF